METSGKEEFDLQAHLISGKKYADGSRSGCARLVCRDGTSLSVQAGPVCYSTPRSATGPYEEVEVGFPSIKPPDYWQEWAEDWEHPTDTVYSYIPLFHVQYFIALHGGVDEEKTYAGSDGEDSS